MFVNELKTELTFFWKTLKKVDTRAIQFSFFVSVPISLHPEVFLQNLREGCSVEHSGGLGEGRAPPSSVHRGQELCLSFDILSTASRLASTTARSEEELSSAWNSFRRDLHLWLARTDAIADR